MSFLFNPCSPCCVVCCVPPRDDLCLHLFRKTPTTDGPSSEPRPQDVRQTLTIGVKPLLYDEAEDEWRTASPLRDWTATSGVLHLTDYLFRLKKVSDSEVDCSYLLEMLDGSGVLVSPFGTTNLCSNADGELEYLRTDVQQGEFTFGTVLASGDCTEPKYLMQLVKDECGQAEAPLMFRATAVSGDPFGLDPINFPPVGNPVFLKETGACEYVSHSPPATYGFRSLGASFYFPILESFGKCIKYAVSRDGADVVASMTFPGFFRTYRGPESDIARSFTLAYDLPGGTGVPGLGSQSRLRLDPVATSNQDDRRYFTFAAGHEPPHPSVLHATTESDCPAFDAWSFTLCYQNYSTLGGRGFWAGGKPSLPFASGVDGFEYTVALGVTLSAKTGPLDSAPPPWAVTGYMPFVTPGSNPFPTAAPAASGGPLNVISYRPFYAEGTVHYPSGISLGADSCGPFSVTFTFTE